MPTPQEITAAAHEALPHANPLSVEQMELLAALAAERRPRTALDIGCGPGLFSVALARLAPIQVTALDINPRFLERGREAASRRSLAGAVSFEERSAAGHDGPPVDLVVCLGASQAFGTPREALKRAAGLLTPGGTMVFAELVWAAPPPPAFLEFLRAPESLYWTVDGARAAFAESGLNVTEELRASRSSWDAYERAVLAGRLALEETLPPDEAKAVLTRALDWFRAYERYGRECFGFSAYIATRRETARGSA